MRLRSCHWFVWTGLLVGCRPVIDQAAGYRARLGIAVKLKDRVCMAIDNAKLLPSAAITLLEPAGGMRERASSARAMVLSRNAESCPGTGDNRQASHYNLRITTGTVASNLPLIAMDARVPSVYAAHSFHSCASRDGVHLTAWDGAKPLEGRRLWKQSYYGRPGFEQDCTTAETTP
jgi:hypothetical protein